MCFSTHLIEKGHVHKAIQFVQLGKYRQMIPCLMVDKSRHPNKETNCKMIFYSVQILPFLKMLLYWLCIEAKKTLFDSSSSQRVPAIYGYMTYRRKIGDLNLRQIHLNTCTLQIGSHYWISSCTDYRRCKIPLDIHGRER